MLIITPLDFFDHNIAYVPIVISPFFSSSSSPVGVEGRQRARIWSVGRHLQYYHVAGRRRHRRAGVWFSLFFFACMLPTLADLPRLKIGLTFGPLPTKNVGPTTLSTIKIDSVTKLKNVTGQSMQIIIFIEQQMFHVRALSSQ